MSKEEIQDEPPVGKQKRKQERQDEPIGKQKRKQERQQASKAKKSKAKRLRTDTFWSKEQEEISYTFDSIWEGLNASYTLNKTAKRKKNYLGEVEHCWELISTKTGNRATSIMSTVPYRVSMVWSVYSDNFDWGSKEKRQSVKDQLKTILTKTGDHSRHLCGIDWCCNPKHIQVGSRTSNEVDKHFHYFLNHPDPSVSKKFRRSFPDLMGAQGVW